jgi:enterochelin esterase-like enzyme
MMAWCGRFGRGLLALLVAIAGATAAAEAPLPQVASGRVERLPAIASRHLPPRAVDVWIPDGAPPAAGYAVLYMHDGQMLFDAAITWNRQEWRVDEVAGELIARGEVRPFIVVGVHNGGADRHREYFPQQAHRHLDAADQARFASLERGPGQPLFNGPLAADAYLRFLVEELKPAIDARYPTRRGPADTLVMGSSMGGLISLYALSEYPHVFGAAGCLSTHWPGGFEADSTVLADALLGYLAERLPRAGTHRLYFDHGTATLDALYPPLQARADAILRDKGYTAADWATRVFAGAEHSEQAWAARLAVPLRFLLPAAPPAATD